MLRKLRTGLLCYDGFQRGNGWCEFLLHVTEPTGELCMKIRRISALKNSSECLDINKGGTAGFRSLRDWSSVRPSFFDTYF